MEITLELFGKCLGTYQRQVGGGWGLLLVQVGRTLNIFIKLFEMVWVESAECPLSLFLFVCFDKHLTEFGQRLSFCFWKKDPE